MNISPIYLKSVYLCAYQRFFSKSFIPTQILSANSKHTKHFENLYNILLSLNVLTDELLLQGYFYFTFSISEKPPSPKQLCDTIKVRQYLQNGKEEGMRLVKLHS